MDNQLASEQRHFSIQYPTTREQPTLLVAVIRASMGWAIGATGRETPPRVRVRRSRSKGFPTPILSRGEQHQHFLYKGIGALLQQRFWEGSMQFAATAVCEKNGIIAEWDLMVRLLIDGHSIALGYQRRAIKEFQRGSPRSRSALADGLFPFLG